MNVTYKDLGVGAFITTQFYLYRWVHQKMNTGAGVGKTAGTVSSHDAVRVRVSLCRACVIFERRKKKERGGRRVREVNEKKEERKTERRNTEKERKKEER